MAGELCNTEEHSKSKSTQPSLKPDGSPCIRFVGRGIHVYPLPHAYTLQKLIIKVEPAISLTRTIGSLFQVRITTTEANFRVRAHGVLNGAVHLGGFGTLHNLTMVIITLERGSSPLVQMLLTL